MGMGHSNTVIDTALIDTTLSILNTVVEWNSNAVQVASARRTSVPVNHQRNIDRIGGTTRTLGTIRFYFYFDAKLYDVKVFYCSGNDPAHFISQRHRQKGTKLPIIFQVGGTYFL